MTDTFDPTRAFRVLNARKVRYVLIGGLAGELLGAPLATNDLDICYDRAPDNMARLAGALEELGAKLRVAGVDEDVPLVLDGRTLAAGDSFTFRTEAGDVDVIATPSGTGGFRDLDAEAITYDLGEGLIVRVSSLDDLIRMKEASGRPTDQAHLHVLTVLKEAMAEDKNRPKA